MSERSQHRADPATWQQPAHQITQEEIVMNRRYAIALGLFAVGSVALLNAPHATSQGAWEVLFDGSNVNNFDPIGNANWRLVGGLVQADVGNGFLVSKKDYADFRVRAEFWVDATATAAFSSAPPIQARHCDERL